MKTVVLTGVRPLGGTPTNLGVAHGRIVPPAQIPDARHVDGGGLIVLPGLVDLHTHLREPGRTDSETVASGSLAAARGGYTAVCAMANTTPVADNVDVVEHVARLGLAAGLCDVYPVGAVTVGLAGHELADITGMAASTAGVRLFSDDGKCVASSRGRDAGRAPAPRPVGRHPCGLAGSRASARPAHEPRHDHRRAKGLALRPTCPIS